MVTVTAGEERRVLRKIGPVTRTGGILAYSRHWLSMEPADVGRMIGSLLAGSNRHKGDDRASSQRTL